MPTFYHATTNSAWQQIQTEGVLWGVRPGKASRCTYLSVAMLNASYGDGSGRWAMPEVLLAVFFTPAEIEELKRGDANGPLWVQPDDWQVRCYTPISVAYRVTTVGLRMQFYTDYHYSAPEPGSEEEQDIKEGST